MSDPSGRLSGVVASRYRVDREIGRGGMATVYLAFDQRRSDSKVALKVLRPELTTRIGAERFVREIRITAQLQHPNILPVFDSGESEGNPFFVMPYVEGETLEQRLARTGPLAVDEAVSIAGEVADALAYAHDRGFVHRDVKPSNIMLGHGHAMLADFGIARAADAAGDAQTQLTEAGHAIGTAAYMSPEQGLGDPVDGRADIYALGCVLYEMLAGTPPFTGPARVVLARHSADTAPSLRVIREAVPEPVERAIFKALAKVPADRYPTAAAFRDALRQAVTMQVPAARPERSAQRTSLLLALGAAVVTAAVIGVSQLLGGRTTAGDLDPARIMMLPLRSSGEAGTDAASIGADIATLVMSALDQAGGLQWTDGLAQLGPAARDTFRVPGTEEARAMARAVDAGHFVTGSVTPVGDRVSVSLTLWETATGREVARAAAPDPSTRDEAWRGGLRAAAELLATLIGGTPNVPREWLDREPRAIASFLRGEAAYRRVHLEDALGHYRDALARDSTFGFAAIRGAQAAGWDHRPDEAAALIQTALRLPLPQRYADFAVGYAAFLAGDADSAAAALERTVTADPEMAEAWMQLGEVYMHLLPERGDPDSLAFIAFETARRLDPTAGHILLHPIEILVRKGRVEQAAPLLEQFMAVRPDSALADKLDIMNRCVRDGPDALDWTRLAVEKPLQLVGAASSLSAAAAQPACAMAAYEAILAIDTSSTDGWAAGRRWAAVRGMQYLMVSQGRTSEAASVNDAFLSRWGSGETQFLLVAMVDTALAERADAIIRSSRERYGPYSRWEPVQTFRMWQIGVLEAARDNIAEAELIASELETRAGDDTEGETAIMARSVRAHIALARGDSAAALDLFRSLVPAVRHREELTWDEFNPLAGERLTYARLLLEAGRYRDAFEVAAVFDSAEPLVYTLWVGASLELRLQAARRMEIPHLVTQVRTRLDALSR